MADSIPSGGGTFQMDFDWKFLELTDCFGDELNPSECRIQLGGKLADAGGKVSPKQALPGPLLVSS